MAGGAGEERGGYRRARRRGAGMAQGPAPGTYRGPLHNLFKGPTPGRVCPPPLPPTQFVGPLCGGKGVVEKGREGAGTKTARARTGGLER
jgi:hypothetical protein